MMRWLAHGLTLAAMMSLIGCVSSPPRKAAEDIGFTRAPQLGGTENLWMMHHDGSGQSELALGADGNSFLTWSPDGHDIAFESVRDGNLEIYTARVIDKGNDTYSAQDIQRRTTNPADDSFPAWSNDCARLAFSSNRASQDYHNLYQLDVTTNTVTPITSGNYDDLSPSWSPDGSKIAFTRNMDTSREIFVHMMNSGQDIRLTNNTVDDADPAWSPSGRIIFSRHSEDGSRAALLEMDTVDANGDGNGDHLQAITTPNASAYDQKPMYSRSGKEIVFVRSQKAGGEGPGDVWKFLIQDGTIMDPLLNLTRTNLQHEHGATWKRTLAIFSPIYRPFTATIKTGSVWSMNLLRPTTTHGLTVLPLGDAAVTVEFGREISPDLNDRALAFAQALRLQQWEGVLDIVPAYASVSIHVDPIRLPISTLSERLHDLSYDATPPRSGRTHLIPVLYGGEWGPDLQDVAAFARQSVADTIQLHHVTLYRVYMLGFSPGFPYMGLVPASIAMPRLATPRIVVPAGSVGIAGSQTGIYPSATPGGWRLIGRTPVSLYQPQSSQPFLFSPGDSVQFYPIDADEFARLSHAAPT